MVTKKKKKPTGNAAVLKDLLAQLKKKSAKSRFLLYDDINDILPDQLSGDISFVESVFSSIEKSGILIVNSEEEYRARTHSKSKPEPEIRFKEEEIHRDPIKRYFYEMGKRPLLSSEEEFASATKITDLRSKQIQLIISFPFVHNAMTSILDDMMIAPLNRKQWLGPEYRSRKILTQLKSLSESCAAHDNSKTTETFQAIPWKNNPADEFMLSLHSLVDLLADLDRQAEILSAAGDLDQAPDQISQKDLTTYPPRVRALVTRYHALEHETEVKIETLRDDMRQWIDLEWRLQQAKNHLTEANLRLVIAIVKRFMNRGLSLLDLIQEGNLGLMKAVEKFDPLRGYKFSTYATWWIRQSVSRAIADQSRTVRIPVHLIDQIQKAITAKNKMTHELGRDPTDMELSLTLEIPIEKLQHLLTVARDPVSLDHGTGGDDRNELSDTLIDEDQPLPLDRIVQSDLQEHIRTLLKGLSPREAEILRRRYGLGSNDDNLTLEEVGKQFDVTRERIRQIESTALRKLRNPARLRKLKEFYDT